MSLDTEEIRARSKRWMTTCYDTERCIEEIDRLRAVIKNKERLIDEWHSRFDVLHDARLESPESYRVEAGDDGDWHIVTFANGRRVQIFTQRPLVIVEPETH